MLAQSILAFTALAVVVVLMPGADTVLVLGVSVRDGVRAGIVTALGVVCGPILWGALAGVGVVFLLGANPLISDAITAAGGLYLCYLASRAVMTAGVTWRSEVRQELESMPIAPPARRPTFVHFCTGLMTNVLNPKIGVFYLSVMPGLFVGQKITVWLGALLGVIHAGFGIVFLTGVSVLSGLARRRLNHPRTRAVIELVCGLFLLGFGVYAVTQAVPLGPSS
ncbi:LysE family translocator [Mycolicibacterium palauense]|uniref:LysE family translocator n=1 Tax=Mycolicibacterium palauense TaxID=2034511 RepID=UPI000BFEEE73|nr:LysE family translocator [Mycolicibacterium palauense]